MTVHRLELSILLVPKLLKKKPNLSIFNPILIFCFFMIFKEIMQHLITNDLLLQSDFSGVRLCATP